MSDLQQSVADFLMDDATLSDTTRNAARRTLRELIDGHIYSGRIPQGVRATAIIVMEESGGAPEYGTDKEVCIVTQGLDMDIYVHEAVDVNGPVRLREVWEALRKTMTFYRGYMGSLCVQKCLIETLPISAPIGPSDGSDWWTHRYFCSFDIGYVQTVPAA